MLESAVSLKASIHFDKTQPGLKTDLVRIRSTFVADILRTRFASSGCIDPSQALLFPQRANAALSLGGPGGEKHNQVD